MTFHTQRRWSLDLDDLAHRLPVAERVVLVASAEAGADLDVVGVVEPFDGLQLRRAPRGQGDVGDVFPRGGDVACARVASLLWWAGHGSAPLQHAKDARRSERNDRKARPVKVGAMIEPRLPGAVEFAAAAERLGVDSLWVPEVWGYDALTGLAYVAAKTSTIKLGTFVVQLGSRSPAMLATSALSLQELSDGRFLLGRRHVGPPGDGGLARCPVPQAGADHQGDHRDRPDRQPRRPARARR